MYSLKTHRRAVPHGAARLCVSPRTGLQSFLMWMPAEPEHQLFGARALEVHFHQRIAPHGPHRDHRAPAEGGVLHPASPGSDASASGAAAFFGADGMPVGDRWAVPVPDAG
jgi:hypothetical protein